MDGRWETSRGANDRREDFQNPSETIVGMKAWPGKHRQSAQQQEDMHSPWRAQLPIWDDHFDSQVHSA